MENGIIKDTWTLTQKGVSEISGTHDEKCSLENLTLTENTEGKRGTRNKQVIYLTIMCKLLAEQELGW